MQSPKHVFSLSQPLVRLCLALPADSTETSPHLRRYSSRDPEPGNPQRCLGHHRRSPAEVRGGRLCEPAQDQCSPSARCKDTSCQPCLRSCRPLLRMTPPVRLRTDSRSFHLPSNRAHEGSQDRRRVFSLLPPPDLNTNLAAGRP